jgi:o-succinylbenzoate---CoA ligase
MPYPFASIIVNHHTVLLSEILNKSAHPRSDFESYTFQFIREWLSDENFFTVHTSGSTGTPKPITLSREQMQQSARRTIKALGLSENDIAFVCLNTQFIAGKMMLVRAFEGNLKIIAVEPSSNPLDNLPQNQQVDFMAVVPLQLEKILETSSGANRLNQLKAVIVGGASVREKLKRQLAEITVPVYATYGMTETITHIALQMLNAPDQSEHFTTLPGVRIAQDVQGCLIIHDEILNEPVITNDLVELHNATQFTWLGRVDNIINSGGIKVSPEKVERELNHIFSKLNVNNRFFIAGLPHATLGQQVVLIVESLSLPLETVACIRQELIRYVSPYEIPRQILYLPKFSYTSTAKINRVETLRQLGKD